MKRILPCCILFMIMLSQILVSPGCRRASIVHVETAGINAPIVMIKKDTTLVFQHELKRSPPHLLYGRNDHYAFLRDQTDLPFKLEMIINPLMRNPSFTARVEKDGKIVREFSAKKTATSVLSEKKTSWAPGRSKLTLSIPYVTAGEVVIVTTSYEWMDIRWMPPLFLQEENMPTLSGSLTVDVPYGVTMHFKTAKDAARFEYVPTSFSQEKTLWKQDDNRAGLGMRYAWSADKKALSEQPTRASCLQVFLSFESPTQNDANQRFDSWNKVANYLYSRIDRYDMPSSEIQSFTKQETRNLLEEEEKIAHVLNFLKTNIERRTSPNNLQKQEFQPATRTFARRYGTDPEVALLGKAMLSSIGIEANLVAAADRRYNPYLTDFYSPALFSSIILAYVSKGVTHYFDPGALYVSQDQLAPYRQGQLGLVLHGKTGTPFSLPYDNAQKNVRTYSYQLYLNSEGTLDGEYSIDLIGFFAEKVRQEGKEKLRSKSIAELEAYLYGLERTDFSLDTVEYFNDVPEQGLRVSGLIKPRLLYKNTHGGFDLKLNKIIEPALLALQNADQKGFSSTTKISLFIGLPESYVIDNLPSNINLSVGGVEGRFFVETKPGQLVVEGVAMVSMPIAFDTKEKIKTEIEAVKTFGEHNIAIHNQAFSTGAPDATTEEPALPENS